MKPDGLGNLSAELSWDAARVAGSAALRKKAAELRVDPDPCPASGEVARECADCKLTVVTLERFADVLDQQVFDIADLALVLGGSGDSWTGDFLRLYARSDQQHRARLRVAYPVESWMWECWQGITRPTYGEMWEELEKVRASIRRVGCAACSEIGPLLIAPGTSGRSWHCEACGTTWTGRGRIPPG